MGELGRLRGPTLWDLIAEAVAALVGRRARSVLTVIGVSLGIAAMIATVGVSGSAANAISDQFDALAATLVRVKYPTQGSIAVGPHPPASRIGRLDQINGVERASVMATAESTPRLSRLGPDYSQQTLEKLSLVAAAPGAPEVLGARLRSGRWSDPGFEARGDRVVLLDTVAARALGVDAAGGAPALVFVGGTSFEVLGVFEAEGGDSSLVGSVVLPYWTATDEKTLPAVNFAASEFVIRVRLGAASVVGDQAPLALAPEDPTAPKALVPPELATLRTGVEAQTTALFLGLSLVSLLIGGIGVSNTMLVSVLERRREIGVRRALGATRRTVAGQFVLEGGALGLAGGTLGTVVGLDIVSVTCLAKGWLVVVDPRVLVLGPVLGLLLGVLASTYPAVAATRVDPVESLRSA